MCLCGMYSKSGNAQNMFCRRSWERICGSSIRVLQKDYKNLQGRSAILDCVVRDADGKQMDVEIQQDNEGASPKRARYHSGLMDMNTLNLGQDFDELLKAMLFFITRDDHWVMDFQFIIYIERLKKSVRILRMRPILFM